MTVLHDIKLVCLRNKKKGNMAIVSVTSLICRFSCIRFYGVRGSLAPSCVFGNKNAHFGKISTCERRKSPQRREHM